MRRVAVNAAYLVVEKGVLLLAGLALLVLIGRREGMETLGQYTLIVSLASLMMPLLDLGLNSQIVKGISGLDPAASAWRTEALRIKLAMAPGVVILPLAFGWATGRPAAFLGALLLFGFSSVAMSLGDVANAAFKGRERMGFSAVVTLLWNGLLLGGCMWALLAGWGLLGITATYLLTRSVYAALAWGLARGLWPAALAGPAGRRWHRLRTGILSLPASFYLVNLLNLSLVWVSLFHGDLEAGHYALAQRLSSSLFILSTAGIEAAFPALSRQHARNPKELSRPLGRALAGLLLTATAACVAASVLAGPLLPILFGSYPDALSAIYVTVWIVPAMSACALFHYALVASERERAAFTALGILVALGALASALATREWGMHGGAIALLVWGFASAGVMASVMYRSKPKPSIA